MWLARNPGRAAWSRRLTDEFLYVANIADNNIYEFSINATNGTLTALTPASVSNGNNTGPDELAINSTGTLLWVTNAHNGTVGSYTINTGTGQLTSVGTIGGFNTPFGITLNPSLNVLYVSDTVTGLIWPMTYNTTTGALTQNFTPEHSSDPNANTPAAIAVDSRWRCALYRGPGARRGFVVRVDRRRGRLLPSLPSRTALLAMRRWESHWR